MENQKSTPAANLDALKAKQAAKKNSDPGLAAKNAFDGLQKAADNVEKVSNNEIKSTPDPVATSDNTGDLTPSIVPGNGQMPSVATAFEAPKGEPTQPGEIQKAITEAPEKIGMNYADKEPGIVKNQPQDEEFLTDNDTRRTVEPQQSNLSELIGSNRTINYGHNTTDLTEPTVTQAVEKPKKQGYAFIQKQVVRALTPEEIELAESDDESVTGLLGDLVAEQFIDRRIFSQFGIRIIDENGKTTLHVRADDVL